MSIPAENIAAALAFSSLVRSLEEKVKTLTADNETLEKELTNTQVDLRAAKTELTQHQEESQQALESLTKKCLAFEEELSKLLEH
jgi:predicted  nucleic acid-binding Zn-ribbon protein